MLSCQQVNSGETAGHTPTLHVEGLSAPPSGVLCHLAPPLQATWLSIQPHIVFLSYAMIWESLRSCPTACVPFSKASDFGLDKFYHISGLVWGSRVQILTWPHTFCVIFHPLGLSFPTCEWG